MVSVLRKDYVLRAGSSQKTKRLVDSKQTKIGPFFSENSFRVGIHTIVTFPLFDVFIMLVIVASSIALAAEVRFHPIDKNDTTVCTGSHSLFLPL